MFPDSALLIDNIDDVFSEDLRINFYRIVQESLNNIMKHSQATEASVQVKRAGRNVTMTIQDNGCGIGPAEKASQSSTNGFGLTGMAERTSLLGGEFKVRSMPGRGTVMTVEIRQKEENHG